MKFIKSVGKTDDLFTDRLKHMSHYAYLNYLDEEKNMLISDRFITHQPEGIIYFKKTNDFSEVVSSFTNNIQNKAVSQLYEYINYYFKGHIPLPIILNLNGYNSTLIKFFINKGFVHRYSTLEYVFTSLEYVFTSNEPFVYKNDAFTFLPYKPEHSDLYIKLLGKAFEKMRSELDLIPYNWYESNKDESCKYFLEQCKLNAIQGLLVNNELVGVTILDRNNIEMLAVKTIHQGKGYGEFMLKHLMNKLINDDKFDNIKIAVMAVNTRAQKLYKKHGFIEKSKVTYLQKKS